jgi:RNA polymerase sigma factor (sigma-70 family)
MAFNEQDKKLAAGWLPSIQKRDQAAFQAFALHFEKKLTRFAMWKGVCLVEAQSVVSIALEAIWDSAPGFLGRSEVTTWMETILQNKIADWQRQNLPRMAKTVSIYESADEDDAGEALQKFEVANSLTAPDLAVEHQLYFKRQIAAVQRVIASLPPQQRRVADLAFTLGESTKEIAKALGKPEGTVKATLHKVREKVKHELTAQGYGENWNA